MKNMNITDKIISQINQIIRKSETELITLHEPDFKDTNAWKYTKECLDSGWVSSAGKWVNTFEEEICKFTGSKHAIAVTNGTVALRLSLYIVGVRAGDEVLIPPISFVATANAISHLGAIPHFIDIDTNSLAMCPLALQRRLDKITKIKDGICYNKNTGRKISAILPVHVFGNPADVKAIKNIAQKYTIPIVEDAAEALGSWIKLDSKNIHCGLIGDIGTLSFNGNKIITTGGGGVLLTNDNRKASIARHLSCTAKTPHKWEFHHDQVGWNDRMPNINAAIGVSQLEKINDFLEKKQKLFSLYQESISSIEGIEILTPRVNTKSNNWLITLRFLHSKGYEVQKQSEELLFKSHQQGILLRPVWKLLHKLPMYKKNPKGSLNNAEDQEYRLINLPSSPRIISK